MGQAMSQLHLTGCGYHQVLKSWRARLPIWPVQRKLRPPTRLRRCSIGRSLRWGRDSSMAMCLHDNGDEIWGRCLRPEVLANRPSKSP
jgi:hypothetical protein